MNVSRKYLARKINFKKSLSRDRVDATELAGRLDLEALEGKGGSQKIYVAGISNTQAILVGAGRARDSVLSVDINGADIPQSRASPAPQDSGFHKRVMRIQIRLSCR
jgi:hypothetical protein